MIVDNLVLGAGISGLAYANEKIKSGHSVVVCEAEKYNGGLCHSFKINGFTFDTAVHFSFTSDSKAKEFFDSTDYRVHLPLAYNYYNGIWIKHPVINNINKLPVNDRVECLQSFFTRKKYSEINNYGEWLRASYGDVIAEKFYYLYTKKYWTVEPEIMDTSWIGNRLNNPDIKKMLQGAFETSEENDYYAKEMRYPKGNGGYESFLKPLTKKTEIIHNKKAISIDLDNKYVDFSDGSRIFFCNLVSSIPLPEFVQITKGVSQDILEKSKKLLATKVSLVSIGFNKESIPKYLWFYIYDKDIFASRVYSPSLKSKENAPIGCSSMQFEIYHNPSETIDSKKILHNVKDSLIKMNICNEEDILFMDYRLVDYANVIFLSDTVSIKQDIKEYYKDKPIKFIGRFGEWDYLWSDQSYLSGVNCALSES